MERPGRKAATGPLGKRQEREDETPVEGRSVVDREDQSARRRLLLARAVRDQVTQELADQKATMDVLRQDRDATRAELETVRNELRLAAQLRDDLNLRIETLQRQSQAARASVDDIDRLRQENAQLIASTVDRLAAINAGLREETNGYLRVLDPEYHTLVYRQYFEGILRMMKQRAPDMYRAAIVNEDDIPLDSVRAQQLYTQLEQLLERYAVDNPEFKRQAYESGIFIEPSGEPEDTSGVETESDER